VVRLTELGGSSKPRDGWAEAAYVRLGAKGLPEALAGVGGALTILAPGTTQALERSEPVMVLVEGRTSTVLRPNLVGALGGKAAARTKISSVPASPRQRTREPT
jgi:hypothetical protein